MPPPGAVKLGQSMYLFESATDVHNCVIDAHEGYLFENRSFTVPAGITLYFYSDHGSSVMDPGQGALKLSRRHHPAVVRETLTAGDSCHNYIPSKSWGNHSFKNQPNDRINYAGAKIWLDEQDTHRDQAVLLTRQHLMAAERHKEHVDHDTASKHIKSASLPHRVYSAAVDRTTGVIADQTITLDGHYTSKDYPMHLRRVRFRDPKTGKTLVFLTNRTALPALTICDLYKSRWQVELFFKWIKQHLRIKQFYGTSENAVKTQIWIAVSVYVLAAIVRKRLKLDVSLYTLMQVFSVTVFEKASIESVIFQTTNGSAYVMTITN